MQDQAQRCADRREREARELAVRLLVTGVAGFIGSQLAQSLLNLGHEVVGVDSLTAYYETWRKQENLQPLLADERFRFIEGDLLSCDLSAARGCSAVFHLAGQPGVRDSWSNFRSYSDNNVLATQALLRWMMEARVPRLVYASSSSVYGKARAYPTHEDDLPAPLSPYGVSKLAGEHLALAYGALGHCDVFALRYFTVYGPRQRPDMAIHRLIEACLRGTRFPMFGDGSHVRDFTYVGDVVRANLAALAAPATARGVYNVAGGSSVRLDELVQLVENLTGVPLLVVRSDSQAGDVQRTGGATQRAMEGLGWRPLVPLRDGLTQQVDWHRDVLRQGAASSSKCDSPPLEA